MSNEAIYLVGGAVRDELLGLPPSERDWVVTGSTPQSLLKRGFRQVGTSFPVFLHPDTSEEYALARTEKKEGHGYTGFSVDFHPGVTLEEDLERRDLTINAIARAEDGSLVDPFGGQEDLEKKILRHVSRAFAEDPLRVLRVARFAARFAQLGFEVHPETLGLMRQLTASGELEHLVPERVWSELVRALSSSQPSRFLEVMRECGALARLLPEVDALFGIPQPAAYHPEIDTGTHVCLALDLAAREGWSDEVRFAVLVHDLGKAVTPEADWPSHHKHETLGLPQVRQVCDRLKVPNAFRELALMTCSLHLRFHRAAEMRPAKILALLEAADLLRRPERFELLAQACEADFRGRKGMSDRAYPQAEFLQRALNSALGVSFADIESEGQPGKEIAVLMKKARVKAIAALGLA